MPFRRPRNYIGAHPASIWHPATTDALPGLPATTYKTLAIALFAILLPVSTPQAWTINLQQDMGPRGLMRHCKYSDGRIHTVNATDLCPLTLQGSDSGMGRGKGFLKSDYPDGMTKVCVYDVLGGKNTLRLPATDICPLGADF
ncbi:hypothetical protein [Alcaligenes sp. SDU_A2]|uniref:hypothetical protein n=1 Tax=Alcaligenes sp. SDU_A2 TaxID=3136634 RepID=UPI00311DF1BF